MRSNLLIGGLLATALVVPALAQSNPPAAAPKAPAAAPAATAPAAPASTNKSFSEQWRASKLIGLNVYNDQNEKLGDISELLLDKDGKVTGVVIGVGGFLGMGQHDIKVDMAKLKFVNEPVKTSSTTTTTTSSTTGAANRPAATTTTSSTPSKQWYPDHAVLSGATKDQLKSMPAFKYE
jgi:sporulation protein YlmC with PRC-barrel domain